MLPFGESVLHVAMVSRALLLMIVIFEAHQNYKVTFLDHFSTKLRKQVMRSEALIASDKCWTSTYNLLAISKKELTPLSVSSTISRSI